MNSMTGLFNWYWCSLRHRARDLARALYAFILSARVYSSIIGRTRRAVPSDCSRYCVVRLDEIGDFILWQNIAQELARHPDFRGRQGILIGNSVWRGLAEPVLGDLFQFLWIDKPRWIQDRTYRREILASLSLLTFRQAINPTFSRNPYVDDAIMFALNAAEKVGVAGHCASPFQWLNVVSDCLYTRLLTPPTDIVFEFEMNRSLLAQMVTSPGNSLRLEVSALPSAPLDLQALRTPFITCCLGASSPRKVWPLANFAEIIGRIRLSSEATIVLIGASAESERAAELLKHTGPEAVLNLVGQTSLPQLTQLLSKAILMLTCDNGTAHLSAALGTTAIVLCNGSHYGRFAPYPEKYQNLFSAIYPSSFTNSEFLRFSARQLCAREALSTVGEITVEQVWTAIRPALEKRSIET